MGQPRVNDAHDPVLLEPGPIATITLNRPERRNGLTVEMCRVLYDVLGEAAVRRPCRRAARRGA
jgi:enoyl-CoA hydratase/carnithine racemase